MKTVPSNFQPLLAFLITAAVLITSMGCTSEGHHHSPEGLATTVQKPPIDPIGEWFMALEYSWLVAMNDAQNPILPDEDLIAAFHQHHATFVQLQKMIAADSMLHRVADDGTDPKNPKYAGVGPKRIAQYRQLLEEVGCRRGFCAYSGRPGIYFISGAQGTVVSSLEKGYYYFTGTPPLLVTNTATYAPKNSGAPFAVFTPIEDHWYIYFESD